MSCGWVLTGAAIADRRSEELLILMGGMKTRGVGIGSRDIYQGSDGGNFSHFGCVPGAPWTELAANDRIRR